MTNIEKVAAYITKHGSESLLIHTVPSTPLWLVCQKLTKQNGWKIIVCNPFQTKHRLVSDNVSDTEHLELWLDLIKLKVSSKITEATKDLKKQAQSFRKNYKNQKQSCLQTHAQITK